MIDALLDSNVLIAAFDESHADHVRAWSFFGGLRRFYTTPQTQGAFLRFYTRPWTDASGARRDPRLSMLAAMAKWKSIAARDEHQFLADDISFENVSMLSLSGFKQWNDSYLIALAKHHRLKLCTLEKKLENMDDPRDPVLVRVS